MINKGGIRTGASTVKGLAGATFELRNGNNRPGDTVIGTCTTDASGQCFIEASQGNRYWIVETGAPGGWSQIDRLYVGDSSNNQSDQTYRFRTDSLTSGLNHYPEASTANSATASGGTWANVLKNPATAQKCGIRVGLLMDLSNSISASQLTTYKNSTKAFVDALEGTPSSVALWTFASQSPASGDANINRPLTSVADATGANQVKGWIDGLALPGGAAGGTNWDAGLWNVAQGADVDVLLVLTDGSPTQSGITSTSGPGNWSNFRVVEEGVFSANAVKDKGTAVIAVGVGNVQANNLQAISGPDDYHLIADWSGLQAKLVDLAQGNCKGAISLHKVSTDPGGNPLVPNPETSNGLTFDLEISDSVGAEFDEPTHPAEPTKTQITTAADGVNGNGWAGAKYTTENPEDKVTITISEPSTGRFEFKSAKCTIKDGLNEREVKGTNGEIALEGLFGDSLVTCSFQNSFYPAIQVDKEWRVVPAEGATEVKGGTMQGAELNLENEALASGMAGLIGTANAGLSFYPVPRDGQNPLFGEEYVYDGVGEASMAGKPVNVTETVTSNLPRECEYKGTETKVVPVSGAGVSPTTAQGATFTTEGLHQEELNHYRITNVVECGDPIKTARLTLKKEVVNPDEGSGYAGPADWTLTATNQDSETIVSVTGDNTSPTEVDGGTYTLGEAFTGTDGIEEGYDWTGLVCDGSENDEEVSVDSASVSIAPGTEVVCTFTNTAKVGSATWQKVGEDGETGLAGSEWKLTGPGLGENGMAISADTCKEPATPVSEPYCTYEATGKFQVHDLPWGGYTLTETKAPAGYVLLGDPIRFEIGPQTTGGTFNLTPAVGKIENKQLEGPKLPLTGGQSAALFTGIGLLILGGAGGAALITRRRRIS